MRLTRRDARLLLSLLLDGASWIDRRVESIRLEDDGTSRVRVSTDFTLQPNERVLVDNDSYLVPLGWQFKQPLVRLDVRDESGETVPICTSDQHEAVAVAVLGEACRRVATNRVDLEPLFAELSDARWPEASRVRHRIQRALAMRPNPDPADVAVFDLLLAQFSRDFAVIAVLPSLVRSRRVLKVSTDALRTLRPPRRKSILSPPSVRSVIWPVNNLGGAASFHIEAVLPFPLIAAHAEVVAPGAQVFRWSGVRHAVVHGVTRRGGTISDGYVQVDVVPKKCAETRLSWLGALFAFALALAYHLSYFVVFPLPLGENVQTDAVAVLLAIAAAVLPVLDREPRHWLAATALAPFRTTVAVSAVVTFVVAAEFALGFVGWFGFGLSLAAVAAATLGVVRAARLARGVRAER